MEIIEISVDGEVLEFSGEMPIELVQYRLEGSKVLCANEWFGILLIQRIVMPNYILWYSILDCKEDVELHIKMRAMFLNLQIALQNSLHWSFKGLGEQVVHEGNCNLFHLPELDCIGTFEAGNRYRVLVFAVQKHTMEKLNADIPALTSFMEAVAQHNPIRLSTTEIKITREISNEVNEMLKLRFINKGILLYADNKTLGILLLVLCEISINQPDRLINRESLKSIKDKIESNIKNPPDLELLAAEWIISVSKLEKDFRKVYAISINKYWQQYRMKIAAERLVETRKRIKDIAIEMGYGSRPSNFNRAFKQHFNMTPVQYRAKHIHMRILSEDAENDY